MLAFVCLTIALVLLAWKWRHVHRYVRVKHLAIGLQLKGHTNAARLAHDWRPPFDKVTKAELEKARQNFHRRFG